MRALEDIFAAFSLRSFFRAGLGCAIRGGECLLELWYGASWEEEFL